MHEPTTQYILCIITYLNLNICDLLFYQDKKKLSLLLLYRVQEMIN